MAGLFFKLGRMLGPKLRQANWMYNSVAGSEADTIAAENAVGRDLAQGFAQQMEIDADPLVRQNLEFLAAKLAACLRGPTWRFRLVAVRAPEVNAFALPGGYIFVTRRLLDFCSWDHDELAFVLAHEMAHIIKRHAIERIMTDTFVSGVLGRLAPGGALMRPQIAAVLNKMLRGSYSQDQELQADALAIQIARAAGFDASATLRVLTRLGSGSAGEPFLFSWFSSHPPLAVRLRHAERCLAGQ